MTYEKPILTAKEMAEFTMRPSHLLEYRRANLAHIEIVNGKEYADEVRKYCTEIFNKRKGK
jgi:hypothetical protein